MDADTALPAPKPSTGQIATTAGVTLARGAMKWFCAFLALHGVMLSGSQTETVIGIGVGILTEGWSLYNSYGKDILTAGLTILRARVLNAAAFAQTHPTAAPAALAQVAAHVEATTPAGSPTVAPVASVAILAIGLLGLLQPGAAYAQSNRVPVVRPFTPTPSLTGNPITDIHNDIEAKKQAAVGGAVETFLAKPFKDLADFIGSDSDSAIALSTVIPELQDGHGQQCWLATRQFGDVVKAHPIPLTLKAQTDLQALRLLMMAANNLCANVHCTQVFGDLANGIQQLAPINASIPIPSLHDLCSKVPQIAVIAPVSVPVPVPAAPAAPTP